MAIIVNITHELDDVEILERMPGDHDITHLNFASKTTDADGLDQYERTVGERWFHAGARYPPTASASGQQKKQLLGVGAGREQ